MRKDYATHLGNAYMASMNDRIKVIDRETNALYSGRYGTIGGVGRSGAPYAGGETIG